MLAAFGREDDRTDATEVRAYVGALLLLEGLEELRNIRRLLTPPKES